MNIFCLLIFLKVYIFKANSGLLTNSVKQLGSRSGPTIGYDLDPNCLQSVSADNTSKQRVNNVQHVVSTIICHYHTSKALVRLCRCSGWFELVFLLSTILNSKIKT